MVYYEKRGRRYYPVAEDITLTAYPEGDYLISVKPGATASRKTIQPDFAAIDFAILNFTEILKDEIYASMHLQLGPKFSKEDQMKLPLARRQHQTKMTARIIILSIICLLAIASRGSSAQLTPPLGHLRSELLPDVKPTTNKPALPKFYAKQVNCLGADVAETAQVI